MNNKKVEFHILKSDYFGTLATILSLIRQNLDNESLKKQIKKSLKRAENNLVFLQNKYKIEKRILK